MTGEETVSINGADFQPDELDLESGAVITLPKDAAFSDASMELVTELPEQHPERAVALLQYTYNDRQNWTGLSSGQGRLSPCVQ